MGVGAEAGEVDEEEEEEECTSLLIGEIDAPDMAGAMSFLPKLSRLLETLLMLSGAAFVEPELERKGYETLHLILSLPEDFPNYYF